MQWQEIEERIAFIIRNEADVTIHPEEDGYDYELDGTEAARSIVRSLAEWLPTLPRG